MRILVSQITRMGDVIQTSPLVQAVRARYPEAHITMLVRPMGRIAAERTAGVDDTILYEENSIYRNMSIGDSDRYLSAYREAEAMVHTLRDGNFDKVYNCSHSVASAMLLRAADLPDVVGVDFSDDWRFVLRGPWATFFFATVHAREYTPFNLCDTNRHLDQPADKAMALSFVVNDEDRAAARTILEAAGIVSDEKYVCMQIGASDDNKRWSEARFAALAQYIQREHGYRVILVGVEEEAKYGEAFEQYAPGLAVHLFGKTSLTELAAVVEGGQALITNDTGTMHIAAAVGCPVTLVSVGYVYFRETGPYMPGCVAVEKRATETVRDGWSTAATPEEQQPLPQHVEKAFELTLALHRGERPTPIAATPAWKGVYLHISDRAPDQCIEWYPLIQRPPSEIDVMRLAYRAMWLTHLDGASHPAEHEAMARQIAFWPVDAPRIRNLVEENKPLFAQLHRCAEEGIAATMALLNILDQKQSMVHAREHVSNLVRIDEDIRILGDVHRHLKPLTMSARFYRDNLEGADPLVLAQDTLTIYRSLSEQARHMMEKLEQIALHVETLAP